MKLQAKLDAFKADFRAGKPPYNVPAAVIATMDRATNELITSGAAGHALKAGDIAPVLDMLVLAATKLISNYANHLADTPNDAFMKGAEWAAAGQLQQSA